MAAKNSSEGVEIKPVGLQRAVAGLKIIGTTPYLYNAMSAKVMAYLLAGGQRKTEAEKKEIKHNPMEEFYDTMEHMASGPTALGLKTTSVKGAMQNASTNTPGATKAGSKRLLYVPGELLHMYGTPQIRLDVVRSADMNKTPDIRTRAFLPVWGAQLDVEFTVPSLSLSSIITILSNAGVICGVGDWRPEKGGNHGRFRVIGADQQDDEWDELVANHGRDAQIAAINAPQSANLVTDRLLRYLDEERVRRSADGVGTKTRKKAA